MNAVEIDAYGGPEVLKPRATADPEPGPGRVRIRVRASSVNPIDWKTRKGELRLILRLGMPTILGIDVAGEVDRVGPGVAGLSVGDRVFAMLDPRAGRGSYAELCVADASAVAPMPGSLSFEEAATLPCAGLTALQSLRDLGRLGPGGSALINGASGGVGHLAVQIARALGARVTAVCGPDNVEAVRGLGADEVVDYRAEDFTRRPAAHDVVLDAVAVSSFAACRPILKAGGTYVTTLPSVGAVFWQTVGRLLTPLVGGKRSRMVMADPKADDLRTLARMADEGKLRPWVEQVFPLAEVAKAHRRSETGRVRGKLAIRVD